MAVVKIEGKEITLPDDVVRAGPNAIKAVLASNGFPAVENATIEIVGGKTPGAPAIVHVSPKSTGKGGPATGAYSAFLEALLVAPQYENPAIALAKEALRAETQGDTEFLERAARSGAVERAIAEGNREGRAVAIALGQLGRAMPQAATDAVPEGF